jgi:hypothetical protein
MDTIENTLPTSAVIVGAAKTADMIFISSEGICEAGE